VDGVRNGTDIRNLHDCQTEAQDMGKPTCHAWPGSGVEGGKVANLQVKHIWRVGDVRVKAVESNCRRRLETTWKGGRGTDDE
jgi:hypothetical protein